jgi:hypothetical protein
MKWLIILGLLFLLGAIVATRYRRQIQMALYVFRMFRKMRQMNRAETTEKQIERNTDARDIPLVRCAKCGAWKPQTDALKFGGNIFYCSSNCLEKAVQT